MAQNDPTDTGGLFIGRRPGTAPLRYRGAAAPRPAGSGGASTPCSPAAILVVETLLCATLWGPQPAAWLWLGSQLYHETDSIGLAILVAFAGMLTTILGTLAIAMRLDRVWKIVRRASGHEQEKGALETIFVISMAVAGDRVPDLVPRDPGARSSSIAPALMGLLDYYKQFDDIGESEFNAGAA